MFPLWAAASVMTPHLTVDLPGGTASDGNTLGNTATATIDFRRAGTVIMTNGTDHDWHLEKTSTIGDDYEIMATLLSGTAPNAGSASGAPPALDTWHNLSAFSTFWRWTTSALGTLAGVLEITIRHKVNTLDKATGNYTGSATIVDPT